MFRVLWVVPHGPVNASVWRRKAVASMSAEADPAVVWLQGFLHAFEWFNHKANYGAVLTLNILPKPGTVRQAIEEHIGDDVENLVLTPVEDWPGFVRALLGRWLFQFDDPSWPHLEDPRASFSLFQDHSRGVMLDGVMSRLAEAVRPTAVWTVQVETRGGYECGYEDVAFEEPERVLYLHAGWSD